VPQWKIFRRSMNFVVSCITNILGRKRLSCYTTAHGPTLFVCAWTGFGWSAETCPPSTLLVDLVFVLKSVRVCKGSNAWPVLCNTNCWNGVLLQRGCSNF
jgi:hypothetical protein